MTYFMRHSYQRFELLFVKALKIANDAEQCATAGIVTCTSLDVRDY